MTNIIYSYYEPIPQIENCPNRKGSQLELISLCAGSWAKYGWQLNIITEKDAISHPLYNHYKNVVSTFPSVNPSGYDYHCYMRWLAMANIGGGVMIDYDVMNVGLSIDNANFFDFNQLTIYQGHVPSVVSGRSEHYLIAVNGFIGFQDRLTITIENNKPHTSDMILLSTGEIPFKRLRNVHNYGERGNLIHCSQGNCKSKTKLEIMQELY